jgi:hypothetical protein
MKHPYTDYAGKQVIGGPLTGSAFNDAVIQVACAKCGVHAGFYCETPKGKKVWPPHTKRLELQYLAYGPPKAVIEVK